MLGALALTNHLLARRSERRHPADGKFITVDGVRLHYREAGEGPAFVLLHGNGVASDDFVVSGLMGRLALSRRVIAFDRPGFGYSERPRGKVWTAKAQAGLFVRALEQLAVERPIVIGHSWGTLVAAEMALAAPDMLAGLVLISGYYRPTVRPDSLVLAGPAVPVVGDVMRYTISPLLGRALAPATLKHLFAPAPVSESFRRAYPVSQSLRPSQLRASAAEAGLLMAAAATLSERLGGLETPTLVIAGDGDKLVDPVHQSQWLARELKDAAFWSVTGAGHMVHHSDAEEVAEAIEGFAPPDAATLRGGTVEAGPQAATV